jgi:CheY-like chemotaxis protein
MNTNLLRSLRVLVVDDCADTAETCALILRLDGHDARAATSGVEALKVVDGWRPDAVLADLMMPELGGYELAEALCRGPGRKPLLVAVTGLGQARDAERSRLSGFDHHLVKPVDPSVLVTILQDYARRLPTDPNADTGRPSEVSSIR